MMSAPPIPLSNVKFSSFIYSGQIKFNNFIIQTVTSGVKPSIIPTLAGDHIFKATEKLEYASMVLAPANRSRIRPRSEAPAISGKDAKGRNIQAQTKYKLSRAILGER